ncbi:MAG: hypothetical protein D6765_08955 [Bacteroidetes bacterium]|nr:MAG: hypothetical protein D6765_08955 [Bacteroidota bacterium]
MNPSQDISPQITNLLPSETPYEQPPKPTEEKGNTTPTAAPAHPTAEARPLPPKLRGTFPLLKVSPAPLSTPDLAPPAIQPVGGSGGWFVGASFAPTYSSTQVHFTNGGKSVLRDGESGLFTFTASLRAGYELSPRLALVSGLHFYNAGQTFRKNVVLAYRRQGADVQGNLLVNDYSTDVESSLGEATLEFRVADETQNNLPSLPEGRQFLMRVSAEQRLAFLGIPVEVEYRLGGAKAGLLLRGGFSANFLVQKSLQVQAAHPMLDRLRSLDVRVAHHALNDARPVVLDGQLAAGFYWRLGPTLQLNLEPSYRINLSPVLQTARFQTRLQTLSIQGGLVFRL